MITNRKCLRCLTELIPATEELKDVPILGWDCETCGWHNNLEESGPDDINPIVILSKWLEDREEYQVCYPPIEDKDLEEIPIGLKEAIITFLKSPEKITKQQHDNIYHNLYKKDAEKLKKIGKKFLNKAKLSQFIQETNFISK